MEGNGGLDRMIDRALAAYSSAEPLAGLEERVLNRVQLAQSARRRVLGWAVAMVVVASVVVAAIFVRAPRAPEPASHAIARVQTPVSPRPVAEEEPRIAPKHRRGITTKRSESPKPLPELEQFPAPAPLTAEERALMSLVERYPAKGQQAFAQLHKWSNEPIQIEPIQIAPIQINEP